MFAALYDEPGTLPLEARLPALHSEKLVGVLGKLAGQQSRLGGLGGNRINTSMGWNETISLFIFLGALLMVALYEFMIRWEARKIIAAPR